MKAYSIKRKIILFSLCCLTLFLTSLALLSFNGNKVHAEENYVMVEGASVYLINDAEDSDKVVSGIRFVAKVPVELKDESFKILIVHKEMLKANNLMVGNNADIDLNQDVVAQLMTNYAISEEEFVNKFTVIESSAVYKEDNGVLSAGYYVYGSMTNLPESVFDKEFVGFVYYTSGETRTYASLPTSGISGVTRSIAEVSNKALAKNFENYYSEGYADTLLSFTESFGDEQMAYQSANYEIRKFYQFYKTQTQVEIVPYDENTYTGEVRTTVEGKTISGNGYTVSTTAIDTIESPVEEANKYLVKNTIIPTDETTLSATMPFWFDSSNARYNLPQTLRTQLKTLLDSNKKAVLSFYIYNAFGTRMFVYYKDVNTGAFNKGTNLATVNNGEWALINVPINVASVTIGETVEQDSYMFGVGIEGENLTNKPVYLNVVDGENTISSKQIFYTDEIRFVEPVTVNGASSTLLDSYANSKTAKTMTADSTYLYNDSNYAITFDVNGLGGTFGKMGTISSADDCSLTDWSNVVLTADIYNASASNLSIGLKFVESINGGMWTNDGIIPAVSCNGETTLPSGSWTKVSWSLRAFGIGSDIFADGRGIELQVRNNVNTYLLAVTNLDIVDYSQEQFPTLNVYYGTFNNNEANKNLDLTLGATDIETISFDYCVKTIESAGSVKVYLRKDGDASNIYGYFEFDANGEKQDYAGVTATKLATGYVRVVINLDQVTNTVGTPPAKNEINVLSFPRWTGSTYYYTNPQVTYKAN